MQYTTMVLELLQQHQALYGQLRLRRMLWPTLERYAFELKASHDAWTERLAQAKPESDPSQVASEALELALEQLQARLRHESSTDDAEALTLEGAMAFLRRHTPSA
jgi:hypothetical protein